MPAERVAMRQAREIIRLKFSAGLTTRELARRLGLAPSTARATLRRFERAGLGWPLPDGMTNVDLEAALYGNRGSKRGHSGHAEPDWLVVHRELRRKHVTLLIVWDEYIAANPGGYSYSRYVAAKFMLWIGPGRAREAAGLPGPIHTLRNGFGSTRLSERPSTMAARVAEADLSDR